MNCEVCGQQLTLGVSEFSKKNFDLRLCVKHQNRFKELADWNDSTEVVLNKLIKDYAQK